MLGSSSTGLLCLLTTFLSTSSLVQASFLPDHPLRPSKPNVASAWFAGWNADRFTLKDVPWSKYTQLTFSFAETTFDVHTLDFSGSLVPGFTLQQFVEACHSHGVKASVSIGGWTGSRFFSTNVGSPENRTAFVKTVTDLAKDNKLDAVDFDWEAPVNQGIGCNVISPNDTSNFLSFLQELRRDPVGAKLILTAAAGIAPWADTDGNASANVTAFTKVLDYVAIMNYDIWGSWSDGVGPNAPLHDSCATPEHQQGSADSALKAWTDAGFPASQLVLGVAAYGHSFQVAPKDAFVKGSTTKLAAYPPFNTTGEPGYPDVCGNADPVVGGSPDFYTLIDDGFLDKDGKPLKNIAYRFDDCSQTPYVYNATSQTMVSFDNVDSFALKGAFIAAKGLRGFATWEAGGDYNNLLLNSVRRGAGFSPV